MLFSNTDNAANSPFYVAAQFNVTANYSNRDNLYGNTTLHAFQTGLIAGVFGVDTTEMGIDSGGLVQGIITFAGSGYVANAAVTLTTATDDTGVSGVANAASNTSGRISELKIETAGSLYRVSPSVSIALPANTTFNANSAVTAGPNGGANSVITLTSANSFAINDVITYRHSVTNTAITPLISGTEYYIQFANSTVIALANTAGGERVELTKGLTQTGHAIQGQRATGVIVVGGAKNNGVAHAGWNLRTIGTGGRAGRVQIETLVAMGSLGGDGEDTVFPDA